MLKQKFSKYFFTFLFIFMLLLGLHRIGVLAPIENIIIRGFSPIQKAFLSLSNSINGYYQDKKDTDDLQKEIENLQQENIELTKDKIEKTLLLEENQFLKSQLDIQENLNQHKLIISRVTGKSSIEGYQLIFLDKGEKNGVHKGYPVIINDSIIVGKIDEAKANTATALLLNDNYSTLAASILNKDKTIGLVKGKYGLGLNMELIPQTEQIEEGESIITSGMEQYIPRGLLVGKVETIIENPGQLFKTAIIKPFDNYQKLYHVSIIAPQNQE